MQTTIDAAGRLVIPKTIRDQAALRADSPVEVIFRDGHIEIAPAPRAVAVVKKGRMKIARAR
ncbi:MAG: AbrB/MazE/SpoVT family DNA-binding domain-containing protein, partial [Myxococcota bacterium]